MFYKDLSLSYWLEEDIDQIFYAYKPRAKFPEMRSKRFLHFAPRDALPTNNVLLVAHLDTVQVPRLDKVSRRWVKGAGLDDRLGVALAIYIWRNHPHVGVLLTDNEESGKSTAQYFEDKVEEYGMVIGLDRAGIDYVDYGLGSTKIDTFMEELKCEKGYGSFSDICSMDSLEVAKINLGVGTHNSHGKDSFAKISDVYGAYKITCKLIEKFKGQRVEADLPPETYGLGKWRYRDLGDWRYSNYDWDSYRVNEFEDYDGYTAEQEASTECCLCEMWDPTGELLVEINGRYVCKYCVEEALHNTYNLL